MLQVELMGSPREGTNLGTHMAMSTQDYARVTRLVSMVAERRGVDTAEAIDLIEAAIADSEARPERQSLADFTTAMLAARSRRNETIGAEIFHDPAWDMMLNLLAAAHENRPVSVTSLCNAAGVPSSTALRHIEHLGQLGLVERTPDPDNDCGALIRATAPAVERMTKVVARARDAAFGAERPASPRAARPGEKLL